MTYEAVTLVSNMERPERERRLCVSNYSHTRT